MIALSVLSLVCVKKPIKNDSVEIRNRKFGFLVLLKVYAFKEYFFFIKIIKGLTK